MVPTVSVSKKTVAYSVEVSHIPGIIQFFVVMVVYSSSSAIESANAVPNVTRNDSKYDNSMIMFPIILWL